MRLSLMPALALSLLVCACAGSSEYERGVLTRPPPPPPRPGVGAPELGQPEDVRVRVPRAATGASSRRPRGPASGRQTVTLRCDRSCR